MPWSKDKTKYFVNIDGLDYGSGGYVYNSTSIVVHSPEECLVEDVSALEYSGCLFVGIIDRVDGSFAFYRGDMYNDDNKHVSSGCRETKVRVPRRRLSEAKQAHTIVIHRKSAVGLSYVLRKPGSPVRVRFPVGLASASLPTVYLRCSRQNGSHDPRRTNLGAVEAPAVKKDRQPDVVALPTSEERRRRPTMT